MKLLQKIIVIFVGSIFVVSGMVKAVDPVGTAIKLEEYFEVFSYDVSPIFHIFIPHALKMSVVFCLAEVVLGVALLMRFKLRITVLIAFKLIIFFTFLTFYSAYFNKVTDCGCFGDAVKLTPWQSFSKDVVLLLLLGFLVIKLKSLSLKTSKIGIFVVMVALVSVLMLEIYAIMHLPPIDFRVYKIGNNIPKFMKPEEECQYIYTLIRDGKEEEFEELPTDYQNKNYEFKSMRTINEEKCVPKILDYNVYNSKKDFTSESFIGTKFIVVLKEVSKEPNHELYQSIVQLADALGKQDDIETVIYTSVPESELTVFLNQVNVKSIPYYFADGTLLKTMIRSELGLILLKNGTIKGKWHYRDLPSLEEVKKAVVR